MAGLGLVKVKPIWSGRIARTTTANRKPPAHTIAIRNASWSVSAKRVLGHELRLVPHAGASTCGSRLSGSTLPAPAATIQSERHEKYADVAQLVEQLIRNQQVVSSSLTVGSRFKSNSMIQPHGLSRIGRSLIFCAKSQTLITSAPGQIRACYCAIAWT